MENIHIHIKREDQINLSITLATAVEEIIM